MRILSHSMQEGNVLVGDAIYETFWTFATLQSIGCDGVFEINGSRRRASKRCTHLTFERPQRPEWMDMATSDSYPMQITVRQVIERHRGLEDRVIITTLVDKNEVSDKEIVKLYQTRWDIESDFRSLKCTLEASILSCQSAEMVEKELTIHLLAYNLIRLLMCEAAAACSDREPRSISFRHTVQPWSAWSQLSQPLDLERWTLLLKAISSRRVRNRPGRCEPRAIKRRPKPRMLLDLPRSEAQKCCHTYER